MVYPEALQMFKLHYLIMSQDEQKCYFGDLKPTSDYAERDESYSLQYMIFLDICPDPF